MFKKAVEAKSLQRLSGADRKKLRKIVKARFPNASDADIDALLPPKVEITVSKFQNRALVYGEEGGIPIFFDADGRGSEIFPTVYSLWKLPELLPAFVLKGGGVSQFIIRGADLMYPGISIPDEGLPLFLAGEAWSVKVPGNQAPFAVGTTTMSSTDALNAGFHGKALRIIHYYRDSLWTSIEGPYVPNAGFLEDVVFEDPSLSTSMIGQHVVIDSKEVGESSEVLDGSSDSLIPEYTQADNGDDVAEQTATKIAEMKLAENDVADESNLEGQCTHSTEDMDGILDKCLLQALHTTVKDKDLPMPGSMLWSSHVLPCRPAGITLDIKKSSHKKLSKWLQSKSSIGLISVKEDKYKKEAVLHAVNRRHESYRSFVPENPVGEKIDGSSNQAAREAPVKKMLQVEEVYKPTSHVNPIFASVGADAGEYLSASETTEVVFRYVEKQNLVKAMDTSIVVLDGMLCDALFKGAIKKGSSYPTEIHKKDLGSSFINRMQPHHRVSRGGEVVIRKGGVKAMRMMTERRLGNKKVTRLSGLESFLVDVESLAGELQKKFACSTTVAELPGKKGHEVLVQGGVIDVLAKYMVEQHGIPKSCIEVYDKTRK